MAGLYDCGGNRDGGDDDEDEIVCDYNILQALNPKFLKRTLHSKALEI